MKQKNHEFKRPEKAAGAAKNLAPVDVNTDLVELWLGILKRQLSTMSACVVLFDGVNSRFEWRQNTDGRTKASSLDNLHAAARLARRSKRVITTLDRHHITLAGKIPGPTTGSSLGSYAIACDAPSSQQVAIKAEIERSCQWLSGLLLRIRGRELQSAEATPWVAMLLNGDTAAQRLQASANYFTEQGIAERAALGLVNGGKTRQIVISGQRQFSKRSPLQHRLRVDMNQAAENWQHDGVFSPRLTDHGLTLQIPLIHADRLIGVLLLDRRNGVKFSESECERFANQGLLLGALIDLAKSAERDPGRRVSRYFSALVPTSGLGKITAGGVLIALLGAALFPTTARITADASVEGELQRALVAPMETYIDEVHVLAGESVKAGDLLATFATQDLSLERLKWQSERARKLKAKRDAAARQERAKLGVLEAEIAQANAEISLVESKIARRELRAPVDGVIVSGDLSQRLGSPVEKGEVLFEIVPGGRYQLTVLLDEQDVKQIKVGQQGHLKLNAFPERAVPIEIFRVTPVNEVTAAGNYFVAYANIKDNSISIKPGMRGITKIDFGERPAIVNWTQSFRRWWSLKWWQWFGWS